MALITLQSGPALRANTGAVATKAVEAVRVALLRRNALDLERRARLDAEAGQQCEQGEEGPDASPTDAHLIQNSFTRPLHPSGSNTCNRPRANGDDTQRNDQSGLGISYDQGR